MNSQETAELAQTLEETINHLEQLLSTPTELTKNLTKFYEYLNRPAIKKYLFVKGPNSQEYSKPTSSSEIYGVYKFFPSIGKHLESNYCKVVVPAVYNVAKGLKNPIQLSLSDLLKPNIKIEKSGHLIGSSDTIDKSRCENQSEIIVKWEDLVVAIKELRDHYRQTLAFL